VRVLESQCIIPPMHAFILVSTMFIAVVRSTLPVEDWYWRYPEIVKSEVHGSKAATRLLRGRFSRRWSALSLYRNTGRVSSSRSTRTGRCPVWHYRASAPTEAKAGNDWSSSTSS
jgi:hypothetical protein